MMYRLLEQHVEQEFGYDGSSYDLGGGSVVREFEVLEDAISHAEHSTADGVVVYDERMHLVWPVMA